MRVRSLHDPAPIICHAVCTNRWPQISSFIRSLLGWRCNSIWYGTHVGSSVGAFILPCTLQSPQSYIRISHKHNWWLDQNTIWVTFRDV